MAYANLEEYLAAYRTDRSLAVVPIPLVAQYLNVSSPGVMAMIRSGRLDGERIGRHQYVFVNSLIARKQAQSEEVAVVESFLTRLARAGERFVFYEPVMRTVGLSWRVPAHRDRIGGILGKVSERSAEQYSRHKLMLSVLVHRKTQGTTRPGRGFFDLAESLGHRWNNPDEFVKKHTDRVLEAYA